MTSLTIKIQPELKVLLETEARFSGKSVSAVVRDSVATCLARKKRGKLSLYERTKHLCGIVASGVPDLATNPKFMKGFGGWRK